MTDRGEVTQSDGGDDVAKIRRFLDYVGDDVLCKMTDDQLLARRTALTKGLGFALFEVHEAAHDLCAVFRPTLEQATRWIAARLRRRP